MLSKSTLNRLEHAVTDPKVGDEIAARLINVTPANAAAAIAVLKILDSSDKMALEISQRLFHSLAGDAYGKAGKEITKKINGMIGVLKAKANGVSNPAVAAFFAGTVAGMATSVTITASTAGAAGNVALVQNGTTITALIAAWNIAHPSNQLTLSSGNGSQTPTANITLTGGTDSVDADMAPAKAAMGAEIMSAVTKNCLVHALADKKAADEFEAAYNAMVAAVQAST